MSDPRVKTVEDGSGEWASGYSKDYWDLVMEQLSRRALFKIGLVVLTLLYAAAVYAPLIANDRPFVLEAIDYKGYKRELRMLANYSSGMARGLGKTPEEYIETRTNQALPTRAEAIAQEQEAFARGIEALCTYLPEKDWAELRTMHAQVDAAVALSLAGDDALAIEQLTAIKTRARAMRKTYAPYEPPAEGATPKDVDPEAAPLKELVPVTSRPLLESIAAPEIFFMVLWALIMSWPLWNRLLNHFLLHRDRDRIRKWRRIKFAGVFGGSLIAAFVWFGVMGSADSTFDVSPYKGDITDGNIEVVRVVWPPLAQGYAETHLAENHRPPTWRMNAEVDEQGHFVHGLRAPQPDPVTGHLPPATPVNVKAGEPELNSPWRHIAGTDELGRDQLVRLIWGSRVSLSVGILSAFLLTVIGVVMGSIAGFFGGKVDLVIMRLIEVLQSIPALFLILFAMAFSDPDIMPPIFTIVIVIAMIRWTGAARLVRGEFLRLREQEFVVAATALGFSSRRIIFKHVLPNAMGPVLVNAAFSVAAGILTESVISFLGFGIQHPGASWGSLVNESKSADHWWIQVFPGVLIFLTVTCYNLVGDAVRDALDPKMKV